jgi:peptidoglycan/xylan/chitin deacetylase (PgdA/CDA1 family)
MKKLFVALLSLSLFTYCTLAPKIQLVGPGLFVLEAGDRFVDPGVTTLDNQPKQTIVSSGLDINKPGEYEVRYTWAENGKTLAELTRTVKVVDTTAPLLSVNGSLITDVCPQTVYHDEGAHAIDKVDGDVTSQITTEVSKDAIVYTSIDAAGNTATATRQLIYRDISAPVFDGAQEISIIEGANPPKVSAIDHCDGDVSSHIVADKTVNTKIVGDYPISYTVTDAAGNKAVLNRIVHILKSRSTSTIYLTFDDGPSYLTGDFLDILKEFNIKATFFVNNRSAYGDYVKRAFAEGHTIAMHSATHNYRGIYVSENAFYADLYANQAWIKALTGQTSLLYRFPGGSSNMTSSFNPGIMTILSKSIRAKGIQYFDWNLSSGDGLPHTPQFLIDNVIRQLGTRPSYVVLMHDGAGHASTLGALRGILTYMTNLGYSFEPLEFGSPNAHHGVKN